VGFGDVAYLFLDLRNVRYEKLWQSAAAALDVRYPVDMWITGGGPTPIASEAIMPSNVTQGLIAGNICYKGITFGSKIDTTVIGSRPSIGKYTMTAGGFLYMYPQVFTWTTKYVPDA
jgi:hypothetical protein